VGSNQSQPSTLTSLQPPPPGDVALAIADERDIIAARAKTRKLAAQLGFGAPEQTLLATAVSELACNIVQYAHQGEIRLRLFSDGVGQGITILAEDDGPGIADIGLALQDGFSTSGARGLGLPGVRRLMDEFEIFSRPGGGTRIEATKRATRARG